MRRQPIKADVDWCPELLLSHMSIFITFWNGAINENALRAEARCVEKNLI
jgi:hypothetical protein